MSRRCESEAGAAGAVHGSLQAGALTTTYTASQGLLLMIPNMYKIAGELLPCVFQERLHGGHRRRRDLPFPSQLPEISVGDEGMFQAKFFGLGADGTVGANKNSVKIIGDNTDKYCQAYFSYDSKKSGGFTCSHLRFGDLPIRSTYLVTTPNFVACHVQAYLHMYDVTRGLQKNGTFLLNTIHREGEELAKNLPNKVKRYFAQNNIRVFYINASKIAQEIGLGNRTNTILRAHSSASRRLSPLILP